MKNFLFFIPFALLCTPGQAQVEANPLTEITTIYVDGNNPGAAMVRKRSARPGPDPAT